MWSLFGHCESHDNVNFTWTCMQTLWALWMHDKSCTGLVWVWPAIWWHRKPHQLQLVSRVRSIFHQWTLIGIFRVPQQHELQSLLCRLDNLFYSSVREQTRFAEAIAIRSHVTFPYRARSGQLHPKWWQQWNGHLHAEGDPRSHHKDIQDCVLEEFVKTVSCMHIDWAQSQ